MLRLFDRFEVSRALHLRNFAMVDPGDRMLFVNVDPEVVIRDARRAREFAELIRYYGLSPRRVCVEILETACADEGLLREAVAAYRDIGVYIASQDFTPSYRIEVVDTGAALRAQLTRKCKAALGAGWMLHEIRGLRVR